MNQSALAVPQRVTPPFDLYGPISADLEEVERILAQTLRSRYAQVQPVVDHVRHYRGKRLRPVLLLLTARACGKVTAAHHVLGAVVEMIHTATLVHDDILDGAAVRRHTPTVNARWGVHNAVLLGDYLFTHAFHLASTLDDARACRLIGQATNRVCEGELCQGLERGNLDLSESDYFDMIDGKTAELLACACCLGALYSGAPTEAVAALTRFGRCVGLAFQIADDLLDLVGDEQATGKSLGTDLEQQKMTLPLIRLLRQGPAGLADRARQILAAPGDHKRELLRPCLAESDGLDYARRKAEEFAAKARKELACLPPSPSRAILEAVTDRVVHRSH
jgi:octaprenyl-diphosphate synthase